MIHYCLFCETVLNLEAFPTSLREKVCQDCLLALKPDSNTVKPAA